MWENGKEMLLIQQNKHNKCILTIDHIANPK